MCPRLGAGGRVPALANLNDSLRLSLEYRNMVLEEEQHVTGILVSPFSWDTKIGFTDFYTKELMPQGLWIPGQSNGSERQPFTVLDPSREDGGISEAFDTEPDGRTCLCAFPEQPILRLRGLCIDSYIDNTFTLLQNSISVLYKGLTKTEIKFSKTLELPTWVLSINFGKTQATANAEESSYALGKLDWTISNDSVRCNKGESYNKELKMSKCSDGEFTCNTGDMCQHETKV